MMENVYEIWTKKYFEIEKKHGEAKAKQFKKDANSIVPCNAKSTLGLCQQILILAKMYLAVG